MTILSEIIAWKKVENQLMRKLKPVKELEASSYFLRECFSLQQILSRNKNPGIIAEFKRKSPSKGNIHPAADPSKIVQGYQHSGASAVSVLSDERYFGGSLRDLRLAREVLNIPLLRKDFIVDEYQVLEAKANGADIILLIAAALGKYDITHLATLARSLGMEVLFEVHEEEELDKLCDQVNFVGVNNRSLHTFKVNTETSLRLAEKIPSGFTRISESGLDSASSILDLFTRGFKGFLIGEAFMRTSDPAAACRNLLNEMME